jgi:dihydroorotate dehydrogenase electron transfer subunit
MLLMGKEIRDLEVVDNKEVRKGFFVITVMTGEPVPVVKPGQFLQLKVEGSSETFLRRPVSVHDFDSKTGLMKLLVQVVGAGTAKISELKPGDSINAVFPLGNSFTLPEAGDKVLLVGGGCGVAPLLYLGRVIRDSGIIPQFLLGFRNEASILEIEQYEKLGKVWLTTEDGSAGVKGYVTSHPVITSGEFNRVYCCGPDAMMKAVARVSESSGAECEVSLEHLMACGFGVCLCCVVPTTSGNLCTCTDGPVFNTKALKW